MYFILPFTGRCLVVSIFIQGVVLSGRCRCSRDIKGLLCTSSTEIKLEQYRYLLILNHFLPIEISRLHFFRSN
jgi:hypothetical protein